MHHIWSANNAGLQVDWNLIRHEVPAAEEALIAIRAARVVLKAEKSGQLSPAIFALQSLESRHTAPQARELNAVLPPDREGGESTMRLQPEEAYRMREWRTSFNKALFRSFIAGAALYRAYTEPFFMATKDSDPEIRQLVLPTKFSIAQKEFASQFRVYRRHTDVKSEILAFKALAEWLIENILSDTDSRAEMQQRFSLRHGRATRCPGADQCPVALAEGACHSDGHFAVWEVAKMMWVSENAFDNFIPNVPESDTNKVLEDSLVILFGDFRPRLLRINTTEILVGANAFTTCDAWPGQQPWKYISWFLSCMEAWHDWVPSLGTEFFAYVLRRYLGLRFRQDILESAPRPYRHDDWLAFIGNLTVFSLNDVEGRKPYDVNRRFEQAGFLDGLEILEADAYVSEN
ncbi:hypothetical protein NLG97_g5249 [Lecanicillium saksenae]|uniref:Uncharacterized protein n=1 Tax=Lecanicillium saksenae TaxID=468837 RepID=A0ACC1QUQ7_9HYPO|nr:hypothetical protein NLG97_g5249 [Lecanicillium saksenae]